MSITDELRAVAAKTECANGRCEKLYRGDLDHIADRIDAEHEAKVSYWQGASYKDGYDEGFASADDWLADHEDTMAEHGWVKLPVDADGVPIRVGDVLDGYGKTIEVAGVGAECFYAWEDGFGRYSQFDAPNYHHHHEPTVEDVLREFAEKVIDSQIPNVHPTYEEAIAEYAGKLRLASAE